MATLPSHGLLDELVRQVVVLDEAVASIEQRAQLGHHDEVEQHVLDGLIAIRRIVREIQMNVLPKVEHIRNVLRTARQTREGTASRPSTTSATVPYAPEVVAARKRPKTGPKRKAVSAWTRTAFHEAGHAVLSSAINDTPSHVSIRRNERTLGRSTQKMSVRPTSLAQVFLAGFAAEHVLTGRRPRQYDMEVGMAILAHVDPELVDTFDGIESSDGYGAVRQVLRTGVRQVDAEIRREIDRLYEIARQSLVAVWPAVDALAKALVKHEELDRDAIDAVLGEFPLFTSILTVQRRHGLLTTPAARLLAGR